MAERAALMQDAVATTALPDSDSRSRLPAMHLRARRAVWRLLASVAFAWLSKGCETVFTRALSVIFARFGQLRAGVGVSGEGAHDARRAIGEQHN